MTTQAAIGFPDPVVTANIYCSGRLDDVIHGALAPFWRELGRGEDSRPSYLWFVRYGKGGEHVKVRLHGPEHQSDAARRLLKREVDNLFATLAERPESEPRRSRSDAPAIDVEDEAAEDRADRSLLWTQYRRSHVSLGGKPFLLEDDYAALFTACLGRGCELALRALVPDESGQVPFRQRQSALLKALIAGVATLGFSPQQRAAYFGYHRDWLLRFSTLNKNQGDPERVKALEERFEARVAGMGRSLEQLRTVAGAQWAAQSPAVEQDGEETAWRTALSAFLLYVAPRCREPEYNLDPFAVDPVFSPVFKVFHGVANQLGLPMLDEALAHHLLLRANGED
jgi:hypothetical protein